jgi:DmsE family decaheme c-type cytochrome
MKQQGGFRFGLLAAICAVAVAVGFVPPASAAAAGASDADTCKGCHEAYVTGFEKSTHGRKGHPNSPATAGGCTTCHGDPSAHIKAGGGRGTIKNPQSKAIPAAEKSAVCLACHETTRNLAFWSGGQHNKHDVSCGDCHSVHMERTAGNDKSLKASNPSVSPYVTTVRQLQQETCNNCHRSIRAQINKPSHHPIVEGKVKCSDCHNPHGSLAKAMIKNDSTNDLCLSCHTDKRGPFIHEHPPVEENCLICHTPHGSQHQRLLTQRAPQLCSDCHANGHTHGVYSGISSLPGGGNIGPQVRFVSNSCINCHRQVHGSNAPSAIRGQVFGR